MHFKLTIFFLILASAVFAVEKDPAGFDPRKDVISEKYEAGAFLIYDCLEGHWTCVLETHFKICESERKQDLEDKKMHLSCAAISSFPTKKACFQRQLFMVSQNFGTRFCLNDEWKQKEMELSRF